MAPAQGDGRRRAIGPRLHVHLAARAVALDVSGEDDGDLEREQLRLVACVLLLKLFEELQELRLGAVAELAGPQAAWPPGVGGERGNVEEAVRAMERHLADAAVGQILGEGANQCQHREVSG